MKKFKTIGISLLVAACAACLSLAFVACKGGEESANYGAGEEGFYYYDGADSARYMLSLQSGTYMITANNETQYSGSYSYDEETGVVSFTGDASFSASVGENALSLDMGDSGYSFKAYKYFDVTYVDESGKIVATESVLNGQSADALEIEKDGYWFIGWYEDSSNSSEFAFNTSIAGNTTVYGWYIEKSLTAAEYEITLDYGDGTIEKVSTMNGAVWTLPTDGVLGWWVSATNKSDELTYKYETGTAFTSDTTLYAVSSGMGASVTSSGITWENATGSNVTIAVYDEEGNQVLYAAPSSTSGQYAYDFTALSSGIYTVEVTSGSSSEILTYIANGLDRVSVSSYSIVVNGDGRILSFAPVENASGYTITIDDGDRVVTEDLGSRTYYNLSSWEMTETGLTITVTAYADGYVSSVSDEYSYLLKLDSVVIEMSGDDFSWNRVDGALEYGVIIYGEDDEVLESFYTTDTSYSLKYYGAGMYTISVKPVTDGYWSTETFIHGQAKYTIAAPVITDITDYTISWTKIDEAESYVVMINGEPYEVTEGTTLVFSTYNVPTNADSYEIAVMAVAKEGLDSSYSDTVTATNGGFKSSVRYEKNTIYWDYDVSATRYVVSVNGNGTEIEEGNSAEITLNRAGNNEITVTAYSGTTVLGQAEVDVYAYAVTLDPNGAAFEDGTSTSGTIYVAQGDALKLGEVEKDHADFIGWYTQADYTDGQSDVYEGKGSEVMSGSVFTGSRDMYLYAYWSYEYVDVTLVIGGGTLDDGTSDEITMSIKYNSSSTSLPAPVPTSATSGFLGWFAEQGGTGTQYTDSTGEWNENLFEGETTLYACYLAIFSYSQTTYEGERVYSVSVSSTSNMRRFTYITIPSNYNDCNLIMNSGAFENCVTLQTINIPDTVLYISVINGGYTTGTGAFAGCSALEEVNIYATGKNDEPTYFSEDGVLYRKMSLSEDVEVFYYPYAKTTKSYVIPSYVYNETELDSNEDQIVHYVTSISSMVFRDRSFEEVVIPTTVTNIDSRAFYNNASLKSVVFETGGTAELVMQDEAFYQCPGVTSLTLPARCKEFSAAAITGFTSLENIYVEEGSVYGTDNGILLDSTRSTVVYFPVARGGDIDTSTLTSTTITAIGPSAFAGNKKITSVVIGADVTSIGDSAFSGCSGITYVVFEADVNSLGLAIEGSAFYGCVLISEIELPRNLSSLGADAFGGCTALKTVSFDPYTDSDVAFSAGAFGSTNNVKTVILGEKVPLIENFGDVFDGGSLTEVIVDTNNVNYFTDVEGVLFDKDVSTILYYPRGKVGGYEIPNTVTQIDSDVFANRVNLTYVVIPESVNDISYNAFFGCTYLTAIYVVSNNSNYGNVYTYEGDEITGSDGVLYERAGIEEEDQEIGEIVKLIYCPIATKNESLDVPDTVTEVGTYAFRANATLDSVTFNAPKNPSSSYEFVLGNYAFYQSSIGAVIFPEGLKTVSDRAFYQCYSLYYVYMPSTVESIEYRTFYYCSILVGDLSSTYVEGEYGIKLNEGLKTIGQYAFFDDEMMALTIPSTVEKIDTYAFGQWMRNSVAEANIVFAEWEGDPEDEPELVIGDSAFWGSSYFTGVTIPARTVSIGEKAFYSSGAKSSVEATPVVFEKGCQITEIKTGAFQSTPKIKELILPGSIETLADNAFSSCTNLESVTFGFEGEEVKLKTIGRSFENTSLESITIPKTVTSIGNYAFQNCLKLGEIIFEEGSVLESIGQWTFAYDKVLKSVAIPASVTFIDYDAFAYCYGLTSVTFGSETEASKLSSIGTYVFRECTSLTGISIPDALTTIPNNTFIGCTSLSAVNFGTSSKLSSVGTNAFSGCTSLGSFEFPESSAQSITLGDTMFDGDTLSSLKLSSNITDVGAALSGAKIQTIEVAEGNPVYKTDTEKGQGCVLYTESTIVFVCYTITTQDTDGKIILRIPEGVTSIGASAFSAHTEIQKVEISNTVESIGDFAFYGCTGLETVTIADDSKMTGDSALGEDAFDGCSNLKNINLPEGITTIPYYCFYKCDLSDGDFTLPKSITSIEESAFEESKIVNLKIEFSGTAKVARRAFYGMESLKTVVFGEGLTEFTGMYVFGSCINLESVQFPESLLDMGSYTFHSCSSLKTVNIPSQVKILDNYTFYQCTSLAEIDLPSSLTSLGSNSLRGTSIVTVGIPENVTSLSSYVFGECVYLESVTLPSSVTSLGSDCFYGCVKLKSIELGENLTTIGSECFKGSGLTSVIVPANVSSLGTNAFEDCTSLVYAYTGDLITTIPGSLFLGCTALETVDLGPAVKQINAYAFEDCTSLKTVDLGNAITTIAAQAFMGCTSLETIYIPSTVSDVRANVFASCNCDIYIDNSPNYVAGWTSGWNGSGDTTNTGTIYYFSAVEPDFNENGTGYAENYWHYDENDNIVAWEFSYTTYTVEDGGYVLYNEADDAVSYVCVVTEGVSEVYAVAECIGTNGTYTVTLEGGVSYTVVLDDTEYTATVSA